MGVLHWAIITVQYKREKEGRIKATRILQRNSITYYSVKWSEYRQSVT